MLIHLKEGSVTFNGRDAVFALKQVTMCIEKGQWVNILGPSGSGKTTLLNVIGGMLRLSSGTITVNGTELSALSPNEIQEYRRSQIGYIFQDFRLFEQYNVLENVMIPQWPYQPRKLIEEKARIVLDELHMTHRINALPQELSGGEKQRTAIARAILHEPPILLCDEPTGNLDQENCENILAILNELNKKGITIILVTHDIEVSKWGNTLIYLRDGQIQDNATLGL